MSWEATSWATRQDVGSPTKKLILLLLANLADESDSCWPSQARIASEAGVSQRTVVRALQELEEDGFVKRVRRYEGFSLRVSNRYVLNVRGLFAAVEKDAEVVTDGLVAGDSVCKTPGQTVSDILSSNGGDALSDNLSLTGENGKMPGQALSDILSLNGGDAAALSDICVTYIETNQGIDKSIQGVAQAGGAPAVSGTENSLAGGFVWDAVKEFLRSVKTLFCSRHAVCGCGVAVWGWSA